MGNLTVGKRVAQLADQLKTMENLGTDVVASSLFSKTLDSVGDDIELAISNVQRLRTLDSLLEVAQTILSIDEGTKAEALLNTIVASALRILGADIVTLYQYFHARNEFLAPPSMAGKINHPQTMRSEVLSDDVIARIVKAGDSLYASQSRTHIEMAALERPRREDRAERFVIREQIESSAGVLLRARDETVGVMFVNYRTQREFTDDLKQQIEIFAHQAAIAIYNLRLFEERQRRIEEQETLYTIQQEMLDVVFDPEQIFESILQRGLELIKVGVGQLLLVEGDQLVIHASTGTPTGETDRGMVVAVDDSVTGLAVKRKDVVNVSDLTLEEPYHTVYKSFLGPMRSELAVPIVVENQVIGVLNIESPRVAAFTKSHERLMKTLAGQAAVALRLSQRYREQEVLRSIQATLLSATLDTQAILNLILESMLQLLRAAHGQLALLDGDYLMIKASTGADVGQRVHLDDCVSGLAVKHQQPVRVANVSSEEPYQRLYKWFLGKDVRQRMLSELVVPLSVEEKVIGVLNVESPREAAFTQHDEALLTTLAGLASTALRNAEFREALRRAQDQEKLAAVGELSGDIVHRLNNPMGAIRERINLVKSKRADLLQGDTYLAKSLADIEANTNKVLKMVRELKERKPESVTEAIDAQLSVVSAMQQVSIPETIEVVQKWGEKIPLVRSSKKLEDVFQNLIVNAVEAMPTGGQLEIAGSFNQSDRRVEVSFRDSGPGIPDYLQEEIFEPFFSTKKSEGHGLGLWWSKALVETHGGTLTVSRAPGKGACFIVRLNSAA